MRKKMVALLAGAMMMMATSAMAIPMLNLTSGAFSKTVIDGVGVNTATVTYDGVLDGLVSFNGAVGTDWTINVSTGLIDPVLGIPSMDLNSVDRTKLLGNGTLVITFSDTILGAWAGPGAIASVGGTLRSGAGNSATFETKINGVSQTIMSFASPDTAFSNSEQFGFTPTGSDFIQMIATITHAGVGTTSFDYALTPVPEPGTMMLLGMGMLGMAVYGKRRMNKEA